MGRYASVCIPLHCFSSCFGLEMLIIILAELQRVVQELEPPLPPPLVTNPFRKISQYIVLSSWFHVTVAVTIGVNLVLMCAEHVGEPLQFANFIGMWQSW